MIELCLTIDAESSKHVRGGALVHYDFERDVWSQCLALDRIARRHDASLTFFYPLSELVRSDPRAEELAARLAERHELAVHLHQPFADQTADQISATLRAERELLAAATGTSVRSVRAGGYNTGDQRAWIDAMTTAGLAVDSSVWPGASTSTSWESARGAQVDASVWGGGGVAYDYRGAPVAGAYTTTADSLVRPGTGGVVEAPIGSVVYEEREARPFLLDVHGLTLEVLIRGIEHLGAIAEGDALVVLLLHSYGVTGGAGLSAVGRRVDRLLAWAAGRGIRVRTLGLLADEVGRFGPVWALAQHERWQSVDRSELTALVTRCARCRAALDDLACPACGWAVGRISPTLLDARTESTPPPVARAAPSRSSRYLRAALALSGGVLGVAAGEVLGAAARLARRTAVR